METPQCKWQCLTPRIVKINTDATLFEEEDAIGLGIIIRNEKGEVLPAEAVKKEGLVEVVRAKLVAAIEGVKLAQELGFNKLF